MTHTSDQQLLLAALRDPSLAPSMFALSLPCVAAERATLAFETMIETLARYARRPWTCGSDGSEWTAGEATLLRLLDALRADERFMARSLLEWLLRPEGRERMQDSARDLLGAFAANARRSAA